jgi:histidinol-phosphate aminotransferase
MTKYYINPDIKKTDRVFPMQGRYGYHRYDMNENPEGLPKEFVDSVLKEVTPEFLSIYPEPNRFLDEYAKYLGKGCKLDNLVATNGTDMAIRYILETFGEKGKDVVTVSPTFEMYWVNCSILGLHHVPVAYEKDMTIKTDNILKAINKDTRVVALVNPNNPMGNVYTDDDIQRIIKKAKEVNAVVLIDEAYHYFYPNTFLEYALKEDNVIVTRTFSKLFSIAALRMGVAIGNPNLIHYIKNSKLTFDCNAMALLFAQRIIEHPELEKQLIDIEVKGKAFALKDLKKHGYECKDCRGNFIFVRPHHDANLTAKKLEAEKKILVHPYSNPFLKDYLRVSVGSIKSMKLFLEGFYEVDKVN